MRREKKNVLVCSVFMQCKIWIQQYIEKSYRKTHTQTRAHTTQSHGLRVWTKTVVESVSCSQLWWDMKRAYGVTDTEHVKNSNKYTTLSPVLRMPATHTHTRARGHTLHQVGSVVRRCNRETTHNGCYTIVSYDGKYQNDFTRLCML